MKKILIVTRSMYKKGGVETALLNMILNIYTDYDIDLLSFSLSEKYKNNLKGKVNIIETNKWVELLGKEQSYFNRKSIQFYIRAILVLWCRVFNNSLPIKFILKTLKINLNYDVAISYMQAANSKALSDGNNQFVIENVKASKKMVIIHSDFKKEGFNNDYHKNLYSNFDIILTVSNKCKERIIECIPEFKDKTLVLHNFYNIDEIKKKSKMFDPMFDPSLINFVTVARLSEEKGILRMLRVINEIKHDFSFIWHIVGGGDQYQEIKKLIEDLGLCNCIKLYGEKENPYPYVLNSDFLLVCSKYEAAPMVIGEAHILGIPVISTNTLSAQEQIINYRNGIICDNSADGLKLVLIEAFSNQACIKIMKENLEKTHVNNEIQMLELKNILEEIQ